jgi:hypothetical protein
MAVTASSPTATRKLSFSGMRRMVSAHARMRPLSGKREPW